jgi:hypothetical protein
MQYYVRKYPAEVRENFPEVRKYSRRFVPENRLSDLTYFEPLKK